jgi:hypothetical protein
MALRQRASSKHSAIGDSESDLDGHLKVRGPAIFDMAAGFRDFEPFQVLEAFAGLGQGVVDGVFNAGGREPTSSTFLYVW